MTVGAAPEAVAGGAGFAARAVRTDAHEPEVVHAGDAAATRPDLDQLDGADLQGQAAALLEPVDVGHFTAGLVSGCPPSM